MLSVARSELKPPYGDRFLLAHTGPVAAFDLVARTPCYKEPSSGQGQAMHGQVSPIERVFVLRSLSHGEAIHIERFARLVQIYEHSGTKMLEPCLPRHHDSSCVLAYLPTPPLLPPQSQGCSIQPQSLGTVTVAGEDTLPTCLRSACSSSPYEVPEARDCYRGDGGFTKACYASRTKLSSERCAFA